MKVTIITVVFKNIRTIEDAILSVASQSYPKIEHIHIDGPSIDGNPSVISKQKEKLEHVISEPVLGIYDAINKGLRAATGDAIGFLNSDDIYANDKVMSKALV